MRALIDTNILIDLFIERKESRTSSRFMHLFASDTGNQAFITAKSILDTHYQYRKIKGERPSRAILSSFCVNFVVLDTSAKDVLWALQSPSCDLEDAAQAEAAIRAKLDCIITRDRSSFRHLSLPTYTPREYLRQFTPHSA